jgi:hypothetical protein
MQAPQTAAAPANALITNVIFSLDVSKTAVSTSGLGAAAQATILDPLDDARRIIMVMDTELVMAAKKNTQFAADLTQCDGELTSAKAEIQRLQAKLAPSSGSHGALLFKDGKISLNALPKGASTETRGLPDLKERISAPLTFDYIARITAYIELFNLQSAASLTDATLWLLLYKAPKDVRTILAVSEEDTSLATWWARFERLLEEMPVDKFGLFSVTRKESIITSLNNFSSVHRLTLLTRCWSDEAIKEFLVSENFLGREYRDANHVLVGRLIKSNAKTAPDLALVAERSFRDGPAEVLKTKMTTGMPADITGMPVTMPHWVGELVAGAPPLDSQKPFAGRTPPSELLCRCCLKRGHVDAYCPTSTPEKRRIAEDNHKRRVAELRKREGRDGNKDKEGKPPQPNKGAVGKYSEEQSATPATTPATNTPPNMPTSPTTKNLNILAVLEGGTEIVLGLDTHADCSFIKRSLLPSGKTIRPANVAVRGIGAAKAVGWAEVELLLRPIETRPQELWKRIREIVLVMPDTALPRDALLSFSTMMNNGVELSARTPGHVTLLGETFSLVPTSSAIGPAAAGRSDCSNERLCRGRHACADCCMCGRLHREFA